MGLQRFVNRHATGPELFKNWSEALLYPVLHRLEKDGLVVAQWKISEGNRLRFVPALLWSYAKIAARKIVRQKGFSFINIAGMTVGLTCFVLIITFVGFELSFDRFHEKTDRIYRFTWRSLAYFALKGWLQDFAYRISLGWWTFVITGSATLLIALLTVSHQAIKAARANPVDGLKYE